MTWAPAAVRLVAGLLIACGTVSAIVGLIRDERRRKQNLRRLNSPYFRGMHSDYYRQRK